LLESAEHLSGQVAILYAISVQKEPNLLNFVNSVTANDALRANLESGDLN